MQSLKNKNLHNFLNYGDFNSKIFKDFKIKIMDQGMKLKKKKLSKIQKIFLLICPNLESFSQNFNLKSQQLIIVIKGCLWKSLKI